MRKILTTSGNKGSIFLLLLRPPNYSNDLKNNIFVYEKKFL